MTALLVALAFACGLGGGVALTKVRRRGPVNIVRGMLLPHPDDERWKMARSKFDSCNHLCLHVGEVEVCTETGKVRVSGLRVGGPNRYSKAVVTAQLERKALAAALGDT